MPQTPDQTVDVAVIGGGSAGICAALSAARHGSTVALLEASNTLGGMGTRALVHTFCGLYHPDTSQPPRPANPGLPAEIERAMRQRTGQSAPDKMGKVYVLRQDPGVFAKLAHELTSAEDHLEVLLNTPCLGIKQDEGFQLQTLRQTIHARSLVDTSGDAIAASFLGATRITADTLQRSAFIFALRNTPPRNPGGAVPHAARPQNRPRRPSWRPAKSDAGSRFASFHRGWRDLLHHRSR